MILILRAMLSRLQPRVSERDFCLAASIGRSTIRYERKGPTQEDHQVKKTVIDLANRHRYTGTPRMLVLLKRLGHPMNHKKLERIWQAESLQVPRRKPRRRRTGTPWQYAIKAEGPNQVWCYDFMFEKTRYGRKVKILVILDEYTRECLAIRVADKMDSEDVKKVLQEIVAQRGAPWYIRSDNGSEFIAEHLQAWLKTKSIMPLYIEPGCPWQNGYAESFNGKLRIECLDRETFGSKAELEVVTSWWREIYNHYRPHSSLKYKTPAEFAGKYASAATNGLVPMKDKIWLLN